jgi:hypothetical protein
MTTRMISALLLGTCLAACNQTTAQWVKPGATAADVQKAKLECEYDAAKHDVSLMQTTWVSELDQIRLINLCMRAKGFSS